MPIYWTDKTAEERAAKHGEEAIYCIQIALENPKLMLPWWCAGENARLAAQAFNEAFPLDAEPSARVPPSGRDVDAGAA